MIKNGMTVRYWSSVSMDYTFGVVCAVSKDTVLFTNGEWSYLWAITECNTSMSK